MQTRAPIQFIPKGGVCFEIGVWKGDFSKVILHHGAGELHLIDPWKSEAEKYPKRWYGRVDQAKMDTIYESVCKEFAGDERVEIHRLPAADAAAIFSDQYFDWGYVDGNHSYSFVYQDCELYWPKIKPGGYLTGDDVVKGNEVWRAVRDFAAERGLRVRWQKGEQFAIHKEPIHGQKAKKARR